MQVHGQRPRCPHGLGGLERRQDWPRDARRDQPSGFQARHHPWRFQHPGTWKLIVNILNLVEVNKARDLGPKFSKKSSLGDLAVRKECMS